MNNAREIAVNTLLEILDSGGYNNIVLSKNLGKNSDMSSVERNMVTELVNGTLRNLILIDYIIAAHSKTPVKKPIIKALLRVSTYQIMFMDKIPDSAVCDEAVKLVKKRGLTGLSGYVNGVLRNIARSKGSLALPDRAKDLAEYLSVKYSHPKWLVKYWLSFMSESQVESVCLGGNAAPEITLCVNSLKISTEELAKLLESEGAGIQQIGGFNALKIKGAGDIRNLKSFKRGLYHIMDINAMKAVDLIAPQPGEHVLDLCASPGGKSFYAAQLMNNKGKVLSLDIHEHKMRLIKEGAERLGLDIVESGINDAELARETYMDKWDKVILDAPCSGLGVLSKKPDARYKKTFDDIKSLEKIQRAMLEASSKYPKVGGKLLYATCTISAAENEKNISWFLENFPYKQEGEFMALPGQGIGDGFYAVSMVRMS